MRVDLLIVGQGLAGSLLAIEALEQGFSVRVVDEGKENASQVAAGLVNPLSGLRLLKPAQLDYDLAIARTRYRSLELRYQQSFWHDTAMWRIMKSAQQAHFAQLRLADPVYQSYLGGWLADHSEIQAEHGMLTQHATAYLDTRPLLAAIRQDLLQHNALISHRFTLPDLQLQPHIQWQSVACRWLVFCEGYQAQQNPFFSHLPWQLVQGDILTLTAQRDIPPAVINYGEWLLPLSATKARLGASFSHQLNLQPSQSARNSLLAKLTQVLKTEYSWRVEAHQVGIRPATQDKLPFIGRHPQHANILIFNGFGARGSVSIPAAAQNLVSHLRHGERLIPQHDIRRLLWNA